MSVTLVTSFSPTGFVAYARRMLESALLHLPKSVDLRIYIEEDSATLLQSGLDFTGRHVRVENLLAIPGGARDFLAKHGNDKSKCGYRANTFKYDFRHDAVKFCHKVFAITHCAREMSKETIKAPHTVLMWLDADSLFFDDVPEGWLESLLPAPFFLSYLGRPAYTHSDCSFMAFRLTHQHMPEFMARYVGMYTSGRFMQERESHDSFLFDISRREMEQEGKITSYNLSTEQKGHVFIASELGRYIDTLKGPRKKFGKSFQEDLVKPRPEPYWQQMPKRAGM